MAVTRHYYSMVHGRQIAVSVTVAGVYWAMLFRALKVVAITLPGRRIVVLRAYMHNDALMHHEFKHVDQYEKYGTWGFLRRYALELIRNGYEGSKYER